MKDNPDLKYHRWSIGLHWLMLLLLLAVYLCIELRVLFPKGSDIRDGFKAWHFMLGISVWILLVLRLWFRAKHKAPAITPAPVQWQLTLSKLLHLLLYLLILVMPILGWITVNYKGREVMYFGLQLPTLVAANESMAALFEGIHGWIGVAGYWLIGIHALAGLYHHYFIKDNTLKRMLP